MGGKPMDEHLHYARQGVSTADGPLPEDDVAPDASDLVTEETDLENASPGLGVFTEDLAGRAAKASRRHGLARGSGGTR